MFTSHIKPVIKSVEQLYVSKILLLLWMVAGLLVVFLALAIALFVLYPAHAWATFGGLAGLWFVVCLLGYGYYKIVKVQHQAQLAKFSRTTPIIDTLYLAISLASKYLDRKKETRP